jgi:phosphoglycolate phosphatase
MQISNLLFDLDGTLTDPKIGITRCIQHSLTTFGLEAPHEDTLDWCIGPPLRQSFGRLLQSTDDDLLEEAVTRYRERFAEIGLFENRLYDDIPQTLSELKDRGFRLFLATSKPRVFAQRILEHFRLADFFDTAHGSELNGDRTDKPSLIRYILQEEALQPDATLIIGDRKYDIIGGKANNIHTAAVTYGYGTVEELEAEGPDCIFDTPNELVNFLTAR